MPALNQRIWRRKRVLPAAIISGEQSGWPWVEDNNSSLKRNKSNIIKSASSSNTAAMASPLQVVNGEPANNAEPPKTWFHLPEEIQSHIIKDCTCNDLISLSLVSKYFRELTAQRLYEKFQIIFPDDDDSSFDGSIDSLAAGLETFVTSDYNYARFLKNVSMDTVTSGAKGERAYRRYTSDESCGKFMNTLMMLTLRQAKKLDTFHWNIRVELSRPLYQTLHRVETLEHLTIRMHPGRSNYEKPPPLQSLEDEQEETEMFKEKNSAPSITDILFSHNMKSDKAKSKKLKEPVKETPNPPTISGFKNLKTLAVLDMDTLEYIPEIKQAIDNSAKSLTKLKISFSEQLARAARKPPTPVDVTDDSDVEMDEFGNGLAPPPPPPPIASSDDGSGPQKTLAAQEAKKEQEAVLGKIFGIETTAPKKDKGAKDAKDADGTATPVVDDIDVEEAKFEKEGERFIRNILLISKKLMTSMNPNRTQQQKEALEIIEKAAKKYVEEKKAEEDEKKEKAKELAKEDGKGGESSDGLDTKKSDEAKPADEKSKGKEKGDEEGPSLFDDKDEEKKEKTEVADDAANPDDINVEEPEMVVDEKDLEDAIESGDDAPQITWQELENLVATYAKEYEAGELADDETSLYLNVLAPALSISPADTTHFNKCIADVEIRKAAYEFQTMVEARKKTECEEELHDTVGEKTEQLGKLMLEHAISNSTRDEKEVAEQMKKVLAAGTDMESIKKAMGNYVRSTRGLQLKTLAVYLIPIKASTLSKAIDIRCLNRITLLNVGPQSAFWTHIEKENAILPLPLQNIQTDNVSPSFLKFVEKMQTCTELFMLERNTKVEIYSTAPKSGVTIGQIRKALRNKWPCLKRLVIRNDSDYSWDANERFLETLCRHGTNLEELGIAFSSKGVHHLLQDFHGLSSLYAFHILNFRNDDTCHWVLREVRKFIVDIVAHHPEMKLEYIAQDSNVERILWEKPKPKKAKVMTPGSSVAKVDIKGKGKAIDPGLGSPLDSPMPTLNAGTIFPSLATMVAGEKEVESSSEEETEDEAPGSGGSSSASVPIFKDKKGLKCRTIEHGKIADVWGVRMWRKEVLSARI